MITVFDRIREKNRIIAAVVKFQNSSFYPVLFALICVISGVSGKEVYLPCIWLMTLSVVFSGLFSDDLKIFLVPAFMMYYSIGFDSDKVLAGFDKASLPHFLVALAIMLAVFAWRIVISGVVKRLFKKRGVFFWGVIAIDVVLILNGAFSSAWRPMNLLYGFITAVVLTVFYGAFVVLLENSKNLASYACKALVCTGAVVSMQTIIVIVRLIKDGDLVIDGWTTIGRGFLNLGWGPPTVTAAVIALAIPAALYLARNCRFSIISCILSLFFLVMTVIIDTRSAFVCGGIFFLVGIIICCFKNKNKVTNRVFAISVFSLALIVFVVFMFKAEHPKDIVKHIFAELRIAFLFNEEASFSVIFGARAEIWKEGLQGFLSAPIFGKGFSAGMDSAGIEQTVSHFMYHNVVMEFLASMGVFGIAAFTLHIKQGVECAFRRFSFDRFIILFVPLIILGMSMLDNFFFYPNFLIVYAVFMAIAEIMFDSSAEASTVPTAKLDV